MFRKLLASVVASLLIVGGLFAEEIKGVFKKFEDGKVTVEVDGKLAEYKVGDAKQKIKGKDVAISDVLPKVKADTKVIFTVENGMVVKVGKDK